MDLRSGPRSEKHREKLSASQRLRLGIPDGFHRLYGVLVPNHLFEDAKKHAGHIRAVAGKEAILREMPNLLMRLEQQRKMLKEIGFGEPI